MRIVLSSWPHLLLCVGALLSVPPRTDALKDAESNSVSSRLARRLQATDALVLVTEPDSQQFPLRAVGQLANGCTAFLIGPCHAVTVAHCVYEPWRNIWWKGLDFYPGRNVPPDKPSEGWAPLGMASKRDVVLHPNWTNDASGSKGKPAADAAIIILNEPIGHQLGWLTHKLPQRMQQLLMQVSSAQGPSDAGRQADPQQTQDVLQSGDLGKLAAEAGVRLQVAGYPDNKPNGSMWEQCCHALDWDFQSNLLWHDCYVRGGNSGSPVWVEWPDSKYVMSVSGSNSSGQSDPVRSRAAGRKMLQSTQQQEGDQQASQQATVQVVGVHSSSLQFPKGSDTGAYAAAVYAEEALRQGASVSSASPQGLGTLRQCVVGAGGRDDDGDNVLLPVAVPFTGDTYQWIDNVLKQHTCPGS